MLVRIYTHGLSIMHGLPHIWRCGPKGRHPERKQEPGRSHIAFLALVSEVLQHAFHPDLLGEALRRHPRGSGRRIIDSILDGDASLSRCKKHEGWGIHWCGLPGKEKVPTGSDSEEVKSFPSLMPLSSCFS